MSACSWLLKVIGGLLVGAAIVVGLAGGVATVCNSFEPRCYDQGRIPAPRQFGLLTAGSVGLLVAAAVLAFRRGCRQ